MFCGCIFSRADFLPCCVSNYCAAFFQVSHLRDESNEKSSSRHQYFMASRFRAHPHYLSFHIAPRPPPPRTTPSCAQTASVRPSVPPSLPSLIKSRRGVCDFSSAALIRQPPMLDIQILLHLFLFPHIGTCDSLTIRPYYSLPLAHTHTHTPASSLYFFSSIDGTSVATRKPASD